MLDELLNILNTVGQVVDTPWAAVRTGVRDRSIGSGLESIFDVDRRATGRQMLESLGMEENQPGLDWGDVAGFATEVIPDMILPGAGAYKALKWLNRADDVAPIESVVRAFDKVVPDPIQETVYHASPHEFDVPQLAPGRAFAEPTGFFTATTPDEAIRSSPRRGEVTEWEFAPRQMLDRSRPAENALHDSLYRKAVQQARSAAVERYSNDPIMRDIPDGIDDFLSYYTMARADDMPRIQDIFSNLLKERGYDSISSPVLGGTESWRVALDPRIMTRKPQALGENELLKLLSEF